MCSQSENRSPYRDMACSLKKKMAIALYDMTLPCQLGRSEQFARLDSTKSSADVVSLNLYFPHSPFLSAVFCDQRYSLSSEPITALILLLEHVPVTFPHQQRTTNDSTSTNVEYNVTHYMCKMRCFCFILISFCLWSRLMQLIIPIVCSVSSCKLGNSYEPSSHRSTHSLYSLSLVLRRRR